MNKDEIKGTVTDLKGKAKEKIGEVTNNPELQGEGLGDQIKGKTQNAFGKVKEGIKDIKDDVVKKDRDEDNVGNRKDKDERVA